MNTSIVGRHVTLTDDLKSHIESTIETYKKIVAGLDERLELMEKSHKFELENYYTKNTEL